MKRSSFVTQFKIEFLLPFISCRKVLGKMPALISLSKFRRRMRDFLFIFCIFSSVKNIFHQSFLYTLVVFPITLSWFRIVSELITALIIENMSRIASLSDIIMFNLFTAATKEGSSNSRLSIIALFRMTSPLDSSHVIRFTRFVGTYLEYCNLSFSQTKQAQ